MKRKTLLAMVQEICQNKDIVQYKALQGLGLCIESPLGGGLVYTPLTNLNARVIFGPIIAHTLGTDGKYEGARNSCLLCYEACLELRAYRSMSPKP